MDIQHQAFGSRGAFFVERDGGIAAEMTYMRAADARIVIEHTAVSEDLAGQGVGRELVRTAVEYAREHDLKIIPVCPFARSVFDSTPEYQDVVA